MKADNRFAIWSPPGTDTWMKKVEHRIEIDLEAAYIRLQEKLLRQLSDCFPKNLERAPYLDPESFLQPFVDFAMEQYDVYARELIELPLEFGHFEHLLTDELPQYIATSIAPWDQPEPGQWRSALTEAWARFDHRQRSRLVDEVMRIAQALEGPVSLYRSRVVESLMGHFFRRIRPWKLEWKKQRPAPMIEMEPVPKTEDERKAAIDAFLDNCNRRLGMKVTRRDIWTAAGHATNRQFHYWQAGHDYQAGKPGGATAADKRNFRRILGLDPKEFQALLQNMKNKRQKA